MKALVLAGGYSSRFYPYNQTHKSMVYVMGKPILQRTLEGIKNAGIKDIVIRVSEDGLIKNYFGDGSKFNLNISYIEQKESLGMGDVLIKAENLLDDDFIFIAGNHVNSESLVNELISKKQENDGVVLVKKRENTWDYGIVEIANDKLVRVIEKPEKGSEPSDLGLVSAFLLPISIIDFVKKVDLSEFNFEEKVLSEFAKDHSIKVIETQNEILTLKYPWDLFGLKDFLLSSIKGNISQNAEISANAQIDENVVIEDGAKIMDGAKIKGPAYIGKNVVVGTNALIRNESCLEEGVSVGAFTEIKNSILMNGTSIHSGFIGDSLIGSNCKIGSGFTTANRKIDRSVVDVVVKGNKVPTGFTSFGVIMGNDTKIGIKVSTMPGVIIGNNVTVGPSTSVFKNVEDNVTYYAKFQEIVEKK